jgi:NAD(P)-dependent dehydrogenase (short-subunit alcohol dehydrogenase family)
MAFGHLSAHSMASRHGLTTEAQGTGADLGTPDTCWESPRGEVIANAAKFVLSAKARFVTGCTLPVGGGGEIGCR